MRLEWGLLGSCLILAIAAPVARAGKAVDGVVNINTADPQRLGLLPGVGPAKAAQIVAYRKRHPFRTVDELVRIKGIGRKMVRRLRVHLAVSGPTTAAGAVAAPVAVAPPAAVVAPPPPPRPPPPRFICARPGVPVRCPVKPVPRRAARATHGVCPRAP
jgi:competence ComEA-like helix-hairpin-helix protein